MFFRNTSSPAIVKLYVPAVSMRNIQDAVYYVDNSNTKGLSNLAARGHATVNTVM